MGLISNLKKHTKNKEYPVSNNYTDSITTYKEIEKGTLVLMLDIQNCYPSLALQAGMIEPEHFEKLSKLRKKERLTVLGAMSSRKEIFNINNGEDEFKEIKTEHNKTFFKSLISRLNNIQRQIINNSEINEYLIGTYSDAVFFNYSKILKLPKEKRKPTVTRLLEICNNYAGKGVKFKIKEFLILKNQSAIINERNKFNFIVTFENVITNKIKPFVFNS